MQDLEYSDNGTDVSYKNIGVLTLQLLSPVKCIVVKLKYNPWMLSIITRMNLSWCLMCQQIKHMH